MQGILRSFSYTLLSTVVWIAVWTTSVLAEDPVWVSKGPEGGDVRVVAYNQQETSTVYAATYGGGVFRSRDGGANWTRINQGLTNLMVTCLAIDPADPKRILVGTSGGGLFRTTNSGDSWASSSTNIGDKRITAVAIDPQQPNIVYAGSVGGGMTQEMEVYRSTNFGTSWSKRNNGLGPGDVLSLAVDPSNSSIIYLSSHLGGSYRSGDGGNSWTELFGSGLPGHVAAWAFHPTDTSMIFAGEAWSDGALYRSTDGGTSWTALRYGGLPGYIGVGSIVIDPVTPSNVYVSGGSYAGAGVFRTRDGGASWETITGAMASALPHVHSLAINPANPAELFAGTRISGVFKTSDSGDNWSPANSGLAGCLVHTIGTVTNSPTVVYVGSSRGFVMRSRDAGGTWDQLTEGLGWGVTTAPTATAFSFDPGDSSTVYAGMSGISGLRRSTDGGDTWTGILSAIYPISAVAVDPEDSQTIYAGTWGMKRSEDGGTTWKAIDSGLATYWVSSMAMDPSNPSTLFVTSSYDQTPGVSRTTNRGDTWTQVHTNAANHVVIDPKNSSNIYFATSDNGVFRSTNGGTSWSPVNTGLANKSVFALAIDPTNSSTVYAGTDGGGVFRSTNGGSSWSPFNEGMDGRHVYSLAVEPNPGAVWAGTEGGLYRLEVPEEEYLLNFAQFGDGKLGGAFIVSQIWLLNLSDSKEATAVLSMRDGNGAALNVDLNGQDVTGEMTARIPADGVAVLETDGTGPLQAGSVVVSSNQPLAGVIVFSGNVGVAGVGSSAASSKGFLAPVEANADQLINTGIAIMSLETSPVSITVTLYDTDRHQLATAQIELSPMGQVAKFLNELTWQGSAPDFSDFRGLIKADPSGSIAATVLQTRPGEFLTMPVTNATSQPLQENGEKLYFAQFADGAVGNSSIFSEILLMNLDSGQAANSQLLIRNSDGTAMTVDLNGESVAGEKNLTLPAGALRVLETDGLGALAVGSVTVTCDQPLSGVVVFGGPVGLASVGSSLPLDEGFIAPMEASKTSSVSTGIAVMNLESKAVELTLQLLDPDGELLATANQGLLPLGQIALFVEEFQWDETIDFSKFKGRMNVTADGLTAATVIQTRPGQFATMPVATKN
jgi:photosystem II stability/assembly factor-like uncharacterized protein